MTPKRIAELRTHTYTDGKLFECLDEIESLQKQLAIGQELLSESHVRNNELQKELAEARAERDFGRAALRERDAPKPAPRCPKCGGHQIHLQVVNKLWKIYCVNDCETDQDDCGFETIDEALNQWRKE